MRGGRLPEDGQEAGEPCVQERLDAGGGALAGATARAPHSRQHGGHAVRYAQRAPPHARLKLARPLHNRQQGRQQQLRHLVDNHI